MTAGGRAPDSRYAPLDDSSESSSGIEDAGGYDTDTSASGGDARDQLEYIADMILELRQIAARAGHGTLSGILDLAHSEARLRAGRRG
jgi:hypothetical protein